MLVVPSSTSLFAVYPTYPPLPLLAYKPAANPQAVYPPPADGSLARPFNVSPEVYNNLLHVAWPVTVAALYAVTVNYINQVNTRRENKPWSFSKTVPFYLFVVAHNVGLAIFSGWVFAGMLNTIRQSWPGWDGQHGFVGVVDALCKINGPRGLGSAATYSMETESWGFTDRTMKLAGLNPDSSDLGRVWNEGLAYYGFFFYLSKFYEVADTAIILAKGKNSSFLQTYHHAGAMMCLWAGIRYMSPPIWMFTFINSGLHTLMYTYYTLSALTFRVPPVLKRTLTSLQIAQIFFGTFYALLHLFVAYDIPVASPYIFAKNLSSAMPRAASTISSAAMSAATSVDFTAWLKKAALRAAGEEGLAENVRNYQGEAFGIDAIHAHQVEKAQEEVRYRMNTQKVHCLDTSGEVFAILLNAVYLLPLAYLFCSFFYKAYILREQREPPKPTVPENVTKSAQEAVDTVEKKIQQAIEDTQGGITEPPPEVKEELDQVKTKAKQISKDAKESARTNSKVLQQKVQQDLMALRDKTNQMGKDAANKVKDAAGKVPEKMLKGAENVKKGAQDLGNKAKGAAGDASTKAQKGVQDGGAKAKQGVGDKTQAVEDEAKTAAAEADAKTTDKPSAEEDDPAAKAPKDAEELAKKTAAEEKQENDDHAPAIQGEAHKRADEAGKKAEEQGDKKKEEKKDEDNGHGSGLGNQGPADPKAHLENNPKEKKKGK